jgi:hypothetical protein
LEGVEEAPIVMEVALLQVLQAEVVAVVQTMGLAVVTVLLVKVTQAAQDVLESAILVTAVVVVELAE